MKRLKVSALRHCGASAADEEANEQKKPDFVGINMESGFKNLQVQTVQKWRKHQLGNNIHLT